MQESAVLRIAQRAIEQSPIIRRMDADISTLKGDVAELKVETRRHGIILEDLRSDLGKVIEVVLDSNRKLDEVSALREASERERHRLDAVEDSVRRHVRDRRAHRRIQPNT